MEIPFPGVCPDRAMHSMEQVHQNPNDSKRLRRHKAIKLAVVFGLGIATTILAMVIVSLFGI